MDILNIVVSTLDLLVSVVQVTWMIAKDVFVSRRKAKHYSRK